MSKFHKTAELARVGSFKPNGHSSLLEQLEQPNLEASGSAPESQEASAPAIFQTARTGSKEVLSMMIQARAERLKFFPADLLADPAWDMLIELYLADIMSKRISVSSLCGASNVPATTALRWIGHLTNEGLVERAGDPHDARRFFISLSRAGLEQMDGYFQVLAMHVTRRAD